MTRRTLLGTRSGLVSRMRVYLARDAVEIDEIEGHIGTRKRVLLDEIVLLTLDRRRNRPVLAILALCEVAILVIFALVNAELGRVFAIGAAASSLPFVVPFAVHAWLGTDYVTVFGKRTTAVMAFMLRKGRARHAFEILRERATQAQDAQRAAIAKEQAREETAAL